MALLSQVFILVYTAQVLELLGVIHSHLLLGSVWYLTDVFRFLHRQEQAQVRWKGFYLCILS